MSSTPESLAAIGSAYAAKQRARRFATWGAQQSAAAARMSAHSAPIGEDRERAQAERSRARIRADIERHKSETAAARRALECGDTSPLPPIATRRDSLS